MTKNRLFRLGAAVAAAGVVLSLSACAPGPSGDTAAPSPDQRGVQGHLVRGPGHAHRLGPEHRWRHRQAQDQLNARVHEKYPNVTIKRTLESFSDLKTTLKLALSTDNPPDVVQANQGYPDMGAFVKAGLLRPSTDYAKLYGWDGYYPEALLKHNKFSARRQDLEGRQRCSASPRPARSSASTTTGSCCRRWG